MFAINKVVVTAFAEFKKTEFPHPHKNTLVETHFRFLNLWVWTRQSLRTCPIIYDFCLKSDLEYQSKDIFSALFTSR